MFKNIYIKKNRKGDGYFGEGRPPVVWPFFFLTTEQGPFFLPSSHPRTVVAAWNSPDLSSIDLHFSSPKCRRLHCCTAGRKSAAIWGRVGRRGGRKSARFEGALGHLKPFISATNWVSIFKPSPAMFKLRRRSKIRVFRVGVKPRSWVADCDSGLWEFEFYHKINPYTVL